MLKALHIENIAVVRSLDVDLSCGMTVLTGETGAGKSIIIDSLNLLSGNRADRELIRSGEKRGTVSAVFTDLSEKARQTLTELGLDCEDDSIMLTRTVGEGASVRFGGRAITLSMLREISACLFNVHGQNDNGQLLDSKNHVDILDAYSENSELRTKYSVLYREILHKRAEIDILRKDSKEEARLSEMLRFQITDIDSGKLKAGEEEALEELAKKLRATEEITRCVSFVRRALEGGEKSKGAIYLCERSSAAMDNICDAVPEAESFSKRLSDIRYELEDIAESVTNLCDFFGEDTTAALDRCEARLSTINKLKRKYGASVEEILEFRRDAANRLADIENADDRIEELTDELHKIEAEANTVAEELSKRRKRSAHGLAKKVIETLAFLDMPKVRFDISVKPLSDFSAKGRDHVEFLISTNIGEPLMPMAKIASGGELARIMLSLKNVLNECDGIDTVIFDEVDTGISGKTSRKVGIKLLEIGKSAQVLCVTHSAQIASLADNHLKISKKEIDGRAETSLTLLDGCGREEEIARILGGIEITETQRLAAREMIVERNLY